MLFLEEPARKDEEFMIKTYLSLLFTFALTLFLVGFLPSSSVSQEIGQCKYLDKFVVLHGQEVCPDKFNAEDDFAHWDEMVEHLPEFLPGAFEDEKKTPAELCEHIKDLKIRYSADSEHLMHVVSASLERQSVDDQGLRAYLETLKEYRVEPQTLAETFVFDAMIGNDKIIFERLLGFYTENNQIKIRMVKGMVDRARYLTLLYDSALDSCPDHAAKKGYYKILNYNGPDAGYDPETEQEAWDALKEKWDKERAADGRPPLSTIPSP